MKRSLIKLILAFIVVLSFTTLFFISCEKHSSNVVTSDSPININDAQSIQNGLKIANSKRLQGDLPTSTDGNYGLSNAIKDLEVNPQGTASLPIMYSGSSNIKKVYLQVNGAKGYFEIDPTSFTKSSTNNVYISITIPPIINNEDGDFDIVYLIEDLTGNLSNVVQTTVVITNEIVNCNNASASGSAGLTFKTVFLGNKSGNVKISYDTYYIPDRIDIYQGNVWLTGTGDDPGSPIPPMCDCDEPLPGFIGDYGDLEFYFDASKGQYIMVVVSGCLDTSSSTFWDWNLVESPECGNLLNKNLSKSQNRENKEIIRK